MHHVARYPRGTSEPRAPAIELTDDDIALALRDPHAAHVGCLRRAPTADIVPDLGDATPFRVIRPHAPVRLPASRELWKGEMETTVLRAAEDLVGLLESFRPEPVERHLSLLAPEALRSYLLMNVVRVVRMVESLRRRGLQAGRVLEVGSWFGSFALALRRLGYDVVACDRYTSYGHAFDRYVDLLDREGVHVVATTRDGELDEIRGHGLFDAVVAAAVIEHVPHTPRYLLETLYETMRPGGLLLVDTPNLTRYWNRRALERGETIFQPVEDQFACEPPWEGHHREYTASELSWMLEHIGCVDVSVEVLDYNMLQFEELSSEHIECLATLIEDPTQSDVLLGIGARPARPATSGAVFTPESRSTRSS